MADLEKIDITLDDLMKLDKRVEIIDGEIVAMPAAGMLRHIVAGTMHRILDTYTLYKSTGEIFFHGLAYLMFSDAKRLKDSFVPDVSFIRAENLIADFDINKPYPGIPDLAIEVISPSENADDVQTKIRAYLDKGTEQVWVAYPTTKEVYQYRGDKNPEIRIYRDGEKMDVESLFPGLELTLEMVFALPAWLKK
jgi:Uma2 family endonuclease